MNVWFRNALPVLVAGFVTGACSGVFPLKARRLVGESSGAEIVRWPRTMHEAISNFARGDGDASSRFGGACVGWIPQNPQHVLRLSEPGQVRLVARAQGQDDLVLVVHGRDATFCSDDYDFADPGFQLRLKAGDYDVYVGARMRGVDGAPYILEVSAADERGAIRGLSLADLETEVANLEVPVSNVVRAHRDALAARIARFEDDVAMRDVGPIPRYDRGTRHGSVTIYEETLLPLEVELDVSGQSAIWQVAGPCAGYVDPISPTLRVSLRWAVPTLTLSASSEVDTSIIVRDGLGQWYCNDDANASKDPELRLSSLPAGDLLVWLGAVETRRSFPARLVISDEE